MFIQNLLEDIVQILYTCIWFHKSNLIISIVAHVSDVTNGALICVFSTFEKVGISTFPII